MRAMGMREEKRGCRRCWMQQTPSPTCCPSRTCMRCCRSHNTCTEYRARTADYRTSEKCGVEKPQQRFDERHVMKQRVSWFSHLRAICRVGQVFRHLDKGYQIVSRFPQDPTWIPHSTCLIRHSLRKHRELFAMLLKLPRGTTTPTTQTTDRTGLT